MPYDPRMLQMARSGIGMMGPSLGNPFDRNNNASRPTQWWEQATPGQPTQIGQPQQPGGSEGAQSPQEEDPSKPGTAKQQQPSLLDMMLGLGRMTRPQYDKAIAGQGGKAQGTAMVSPWAWLGSLGMPGGGQPR
jgi:hypothetical protein